MLDSDRNYCDNRITYTLEGSLSSGRSLLVSLAGLGGATYKTYASAIALDELAIAAFAGAHIVCLCVYPILILPQTHCTELLPPRVCSFEIHFQIFSIRAVGDFESAVESQDSHGGDCIYVPFLESFGAIVKVEYLSLVDKVSKVVLF